MLDIFLISVVGTITLVGIIAIFIAFIQSERYHNRLEREAIDKETERRKWDIRYHWNKDD